MLRMLSQGFVSTLMAVALVLLSVVGFQSGSSYGEVRNTPSMGERVYKVLGGARKAVDNNQYEKAEEMLNNLRKRRLNSYEEAMTWNLTAFIHYSQENAPQAIAAYEKVLAQPDIPLGLEQSALFSVAQLHAIEEQFQASLQALKKWFSLTDEPGANAYSLLGQIYYQLQQYDKAREPIETAIRKAVNAGETPKENLYLLMRAIDYQQNDYNSLKNTLRNLIIDYPKPQYWVQLAAVYGELNQPQIQASILESAYTKGYLKKERDLVSLAQHFLSQEVPDKAGKVLQKGLREGIIDATEPNLKLQGDAWLLAKEYDLALNAFQQAAKKADTGDLYMRMAQIQMDLNRWQEAADLATRAIKKGDLSKPGMARVIKGLSLYNQNKLTAAGKAFSSAQSFPETKAVATKWLDYVKKEQHRKAELKRLSEA